MTDRTVIILGLVVFFVILALGKPKKATAATVAEEAIETAAEAAIE